MPLIEVVGLSKIYGDDGAHTIALSGVTFTIEKGDFVAIMGPSGSGKSTLLNILGFLDRPTKGIYRFEGKSIDAHSDEGLARVRNKKMGFIFQSFNLLPRTSVLENVKLPLLYSAIHESKWDGLAKKAIEHVGLSHRMHYEPSELSGGERQRVAIARALVNEPEIIFADEPTGNLDSRSGELVMQTIRSLNKDHARTILLITHETYTAEYARRIIRLRDGAIEKDELVSNQRQTHDAFIK